MMRWRIGCIALAVSICAAAPALVTPASEAPAAGPTTRPASAPTTRPSRTRDPSDQFLRFVEDRNGGGKLQAAIVTYHGPNGVTVHLVSALHVADKSFYDGLNKTFAGYDALLYEMIKPKGAPPPQPGQQSGSAISSFQRFLKDVLKLDFQLDDIDYTKPNFVHGDLDYETFAKLQEQRGESILGIMIQSMIREMSREAAGEKGNVPDVGLFDLIAALRSPDRPRQFKLMLAREFDDIEDQMAGLDGPNGSVIITERNKACIAALQQEIADGKKNIGIFFGAGHMKDMQQRLKELGFKRTGIEWRVGWDMTVQPGDPSTRPSTRPLFVPVPEDSSR